MVRSAGGSQVPNDDYEAFVAQDKNQSKCVATSNARLPPSNFKSAPLNVFPNTSVTTQHEDVQPVLNRSEEVTPVLGSLNGDALPHSNVPKAGIESEPTVANNFQEGASTHSEADDTCGTNHGSACVGGRVDTTVNSIDDVICSPEIVSDDDDENISTHDNREQSQHGLQPANSSHNGDDEAICTGAASEQFQPADLGDESKHWLYLSGNKQF
ncbi:hypothetical protein V6N12_061654 [Hibiscus sabdariffa]|uniref:Uncharacterized protein n=1 Tax=Hibiscus sabdariffa TaxID=183260 RepID=A0ABR2DXP2_9ROSI